MLTTKLLTERMRIENPIHKIIKELKTEHSKNNNYQKNKDTRNVLDALNKFNSIIEKQPYDISKSVRFIFNKSKN